MSALFGPKLALARAAGALSRRSGRGGGTTLPGRLLLRLAPDAISRLSARLPGGSVIVSATNGKTTTAGMLAAALRAAGRTPVHNRAGSNMSWGVATALLEQRGDEGLFEVDEAWLPKVTQEVDPRLIVLGNLFRDQLDRYGELEHLADEWAELVAVRARGTEFVLNADDPLVADLGRDRDLARRPGVTYFGIDDPAQALPELQHAFDAKHCRRCGAPYAYERAFVGHLGHYECPSCAADRPAPDISATHIRLEGMGGSRVSVRTPDGAIELHLPLPGLYNVYNALAALTAALRVGVPLEVAARAMERMEAVFGRVETITVAERAVSILLIKNPAGTNEVLRTLLLEAGANNGGLGLWIALNDRIAVQAGQLRRRRLVRGWDGRRGPACWRRAWPPCWYCSPHRRCRRPVSAADQLAEACRTTFDRVDSDGCMSTNDTVILMSSGASGVRPAADDFQAALTETCRDLARQLLHDARGIGPRHHAHRATCRLRGGRRGGGPRNRPQQPLQVRDLCRDPNWGRVLAAIGTTGAEFEPDRIDVAFNGVQVCRHGAIGDPRDLVDLSAREVESRWPCNGTHAATIWTNDLTYDYVRENAEYST